MVDATRTRIKAGNYYQLPEYEQHDLIQLIDGEVVIGMPPILKHQTIVKKIMALLIQTEASQGGIAFVAPTEVYLDENNVYEPDVVFVTPANLAITQQDEKRIVGAPDLVVEVLSPSTAKFDRQEKYQAYEQAGVGEYWIVDPLHETIEVWTLGESKQFLRQGAYGKTGTFQSVTLGTAVTVKAIFDV
jgi:Uma2 family endonuclease